MDIVERARVRNMPHGHLELIDKLADEIERLNTGIYTMAVEAERLRMTINDQAALADRLRQTNNELFEDNEALRLVATAHELEIDRLTKIAQAACDETFQKQTEIDRLCGQLRAKVEMLRALLRRHQVAAWCKEDSDLAIETRAALERKP
jgi:hypothetical protein